MKLHSEFSREFFKTVFARLPPLASAARCGPHPHTPRYASGASEHRWTTYETSRNPGDKVGVLASEVVIWRRLGDDDRSSPAGRHCCRRNDTHAACDHGIIVPCWALIAGDGRFGCGPESDSLVSK